MPLREFDHLATKFSKEELFANTPLGNNALFNPITSKNIYYLVIKLVKDRGTVGINSIVKFSSKILMENNIINKF